MQPCTPNCQQVLRGTLFGSRLLKSGLSVSLKIPHGTDPVLYCEDLMVERGVTSRETLREMRGIPRGRWIVKTGRNVDSAVIAATQDPLVCAAVLGLSGTTFYHADRPIIWTKERLGRSVSLHRLGEFYDD